MIFFLLSFQREQQAQVSLADYRDARHHELPVQTRRRPSMLGENYHHAHAAAAAHAPTIDRDR